MGGERVNASTRRNGRLPRLSLVASFRPFWAPPSRNLPVPFSFVSQSSVDTYFSFFCLQKLFLKQNLHSSFFLRPVQIFGVCGPCTPFFLPFTPNTPPFLKNRLPVFFFFQRVKGITTPLNFCCSDRWTTLLLPYYLLFSFAESPISSAILKRMFQLIKRGRTGTEGKIFPVLA